MEEKIYEALSNVIETTLNKKEAIELLSKDDTDIAEVFSLNSLLTVQFIIELEQVFDIEIDMEDLDMAIFRNTKALKDEIKKILQEDSYGM